MSVEQETSPQARDAKTGVPGSAHPWAREPTPCGFLNLGLIGVPRAEALMETLATMRIAGEIEDATLFLSHPKTIAVGCKDRRFAYSQDLLVPPARLEDQGIEFVRSMRGGGITYHWPGQVLCYPVLYLPPGDRDIGLYMFRLEEVALRALHKLGVEAYRRRDTPAHVGLWHEGRKVASMGVRVARWITSFGFALNVEGDVSPSEYIRPCGIRDARLVTLGQILRFPPPRGTVIDAVKEAFEAVFHQESRELPNTLPMRLAVPTGPDGP